MNSDAFWSLKKINQTSCEICAKESQNHYSWKRASSPTINSSPLCPLIESLLLEKASKVIQVQLPTDHQYCPLSHIPGDKEMKTAKAKRTHKTQDGFSLRSTLCQQETKTSTLQKHLLPRNQMIRASLLKENKLHPKITILCLHHGGNKPRDALKAATWHPTQTKGTKCMLGAALVPALV